MRWINMAALTCLIGPWVGDSASGQAPKPAPPGAAAPRVVPDPAQAIAPPPGIANRPVNDPAMQRRMDNLLALWEQQSAKVKTLDALFSREDVLKAWGEKTHYIGRAILKSPNLAFLDFQKVEEGGKLSAYEQIRCTGDEVYHYRNTTNQIFVFPMAAQERQRALEEGPLPFMFNMRADAAKKRYDMILVEETLTHYWIRIQPKEAIDREAFLQADVLLDRQTFMPESLRLLAPNGKDTQIFRFKGELLGTPQARDPKVAQVKGQQAFIKPNAPVNDANFQGKVLKGWQVVRNPAPDAQPRREVGGAPARTPQPAMKPGAGAGRR